MVNWDDPTAGDDEDCGMPIVFVVFGNILLWFVIVPVVLYFIFR